MQKQINPTKHKQPSHQVQTVSISQQITSPIPPPHILKEYDQISPGSAEKILNEFYLQGAHRRKLETEVISSQLSESSRGQIMAFTITIVTIGLSFYAIIKGFQLGGSILGGSALLTVVGLFINGARSQRKSLEKKDPSS